MLVSRRERQIAGRGARGEMHDSKGLGTRKFRRCSLSLAVCDPTSIPMEPAYGRFSYLTPVALCATGTCFRLPLES